MSIKNELILSYIKKLDVGTKISVRRLSEILNVSVGTVYKAIKAAEAQGLVVTKPKSGTFKIDSGVIGEAEPVSLKRAAKFLGLTMIIEPADAERMLRRVVICDGSEKQLRRALSDEPKDNVNVLCLVGDRPGYAGARYRAWSKPYAYGRCKRAAAHTYSGRALRTFRYKCFAGQPNDNDAA